MTHRKHTALMACAASIAAMFVADAAAQTLYKLIDKNGKVTYSEKPPKDYDGQVIRLDIDPNANTATLPKPPAAAKKAESNSDGPRKAAEPEKPSRAAQLEAARARLDSARRALADARDNPKDGEVRWIGNVGGGTRAQPSEDYAKRLTELEDRVREAEENVRKLEE